MHCVFVTSPKALKPPAIRRGRPGVSAVSCRLTLHICSCANFRRAIMTQSLGCFFAWLPALVWDKLWQPSSLFLLKTGQDSCPGPHMRLSPPGLRRGAGLIPGGLQHPSPQELLEWPGHSSRTMRSMCPPGPHFARNIPWAPSKWPWAGGMAGHPTMNPGDFGTTSTRGAC